MALGRDDLEAAFRRHARGLSAEDTASMPRTVALDGKTLRGSFDHLTDRKAAHVQRICQRRRPDPRPPGTGRGAGRDRSGAEADGRAIRAHWRIKNQAQYVRDVALGEDASRIRTQPGVMARIRSLALNILRANGVQNVSLALYANAVSFDQLLALGTS